MIRRIGLTDDDILELIDHELEHGGVGVLPEEDRKLLWDNGYSYQLYGNGNEVSELQIVLETGDGEEEDDG